MVNDVLAIRDLEVYTRIGVTEEERSAPQRVLVTAEMAVDAAEVARRDDISVSIDYAAVCTLIHSLADTERRTIERFAEDIATALLDQFSPADVMVTVKKFAIPGLGEASIQIRRER